MKNAYYERMGYKYRKGRRLDDSGQMTVKMPNYLLDALTTEAIAKDTSRTEILRQIVAAHFQHLANKTDPIGDSNT